MKKLLLAATALAGLTAAASAADLPRREYAPAPVPVAAVPAFTWTGFYLGAHAGGAVAGDFRASEVDVAIPGRASLSAGGYVAGGQVGYNYQFGQGSGIVVGVEGDVAYSDIHNEIGLSLPGFAAASLRVRTDGLSANARGRVGYAFDRFMVYGTGGYAYTDTTVGVAAGTFAGPALGLSTSRGLDGWTVGGGIEAAVWNNWSVKAEYLYSKYDGQRYDLGNVSTGSLPFRGELETHVLKVGANYRFNGLSGLGF